jgi:GDP-L-fucose synthase
LAPRWLAREGVELLTASRSEADLRDQAAVNAWFAAKRPQVVFLAAGKVGGIVANNTLRAEFLYDNLAIATNVIHAAHVQRRRKADVPRLLLHRSKTGAAAVARGQHADRPLEPTNEPYAIAKIAGIKMVEAYRSQYGAEFINVMPTNLYGRGDNYHPEYTARSVLTPRGRTARRENCSTLAGWRNSAGGSTSLEDGIRLAYGAYLDETSGR